MSLRNSRNRTAKRLWVTNVTGSTTSSLSFFSSPSSKTRDKQIATRVTDSARQERHKKKRDCSQSYWRSYYLHFLSWSSLHTSVLGLLQKDLFKGRWNLRQIFFKQIYCHTCHTRFAVFFPLLSCGSLIGSLRGRRKTPYPFRRLLRRLLIGSLSNDEGNGNEDGKKPIGLDW